MLLMGVYSIVLQSNVLGLDVSKCRFKSPTDAYVLIAIVSLAVVEECIYASSITQYTANSDESIIKKGVWGVA